MATAWTGAIGFALVTIPVGLHKATEDKSVGLNMIHRSDCGKVQYVKRCSLCSEELAFDQVGKGYQLADGTMVEITPTELEGLPIAPKKTCELLRFVPAGAVDSLAADASYFVQPRGGGERAFVLLHAAMEKTGLVAIARLVMRERQRLAMLSVRGDGLLLTTIRWPDEVRQPEFPLPEAPVRAQELQMATSLIKSMAGPYRVEDFRDDYREALAALVAAKTAGGAVLARSKPEAKPSPDIAAALRASLAQAKESRPARKPVKVPATKAS